MQPTVELASDFHGSARTVERWTGARRKKKKEREEEGGVQKNRGQLRFTNSPWTRCTSLAAHVLAEARPRIAIAIALARGSSILSNVLSAASDKADVDRAMRPSSTMHSSSATDDTASNTSSEGSSRNRLASVGRASILPICPRAHAAELATAWLRSSRRSIITAMSSGCRRAQRQALARMSGSVCRRKDRKMSDGRVACSCAATATARPSAGPCTTPRTINRETACAASRLPITASVRRAADCSGTM